MAFADAVMDWYAVHARDLPWRRPGTSPWAVLVSESMLQQTPVARVLPVWTEWLRRWPEPAALAAAPAGDAVRAWGRLGYPRRALRLHESARIVTDRYAGRVPDDLTDLLALPGVGDYTARAVACFAYSRRVAVVDTNVRRFVARACSGQEVAGPASTARDNAAVEQLLPVRPEAAARFSVAVMELGALICTARSPACGVCPVRRSCAWVKAGRPAYSGPRRPAQGFTGTDRQVRGLLLDVVRTSDGAVAPADLAVLWPGIEQRERALAGLVTDGLVVPVVGGYALPS